MLIYALSCRGCCFVFMDKGPLWQGLRHGRLTTFRLTTLVAPVPVRKRSRHQSLRRSQERRSRMWTFAKRADPEHYAVAGQTARR